MNWWKSFSEEWPLLAALIRNRSNEVDTALLNVIETIACQILVNSQMLPEKEDAVAKTKEHKVMGEYKRGKLHSGSKEGPKVKLRKQAVAIALAEKRRGKEK